VPITTLADANRSSSPSWTRAARPLRDGPTKPPLALGRISRAPLSGIEPLQAGVLGRAPTTVLRNTAVSAGLADAEVNGE
jgi:hypothetical protein